MSLSDERKDDKSVPPVVEAEDVDAFFDVIPVAPSDLDSGKVNKKQEYRVDRIQRKNTGRPRPSPSPTSDSPCPESTGWSFLRSVRSRNEANEA